MSAIDELARALAKQQSGHWGLVELVRSSPPDATSLDPLLQNFGGPKLRFAGSSTGTLIDYESAKPTDIDGLATRISNCLTQAQKDGHRVVRCLITGFDQLPVATQCLILRQTRSAREASSDVRLQTVLVGKWNYFRVQEHWKDHFQSLSPAIDSKHVYYDDGLSIEIVIELLQQRACVQQQPRPFDYTCAGAILEVSGGDPFFVEYIISALCRRPGRFAEFEALLAHLHEEGGVKDEIKSRIDHLQADAFALLETVLRQPVVSCPERTPAAEDLRLAGFIKTKPAGALLCLSVSSLLIDRVIRTCWMPREKSHKAIYAGTDLAQPIQAVNTEAYQIVAGIENLLRNLLILSLSVDGDWAKSLAGVNTIAQDGGDIPNELLGLAREINALLRVPTDSTSFSESDTDDTPSSSSEKARRPKSQPIAEVAKDWRDRQQKNTVLTLGHDSLVYFFTTEALVSVLINEKQGIYARTVKCFFPDKHELITMLQHYVAIRAAVAHNQPIALQSIQRLEILRDEFEKRICQGADWESPRIR